MLACNILLDSSILFPFLSKWHAIKNINCCLPSYIQTISHFCSSSFGVQLVAIIRSKLLILVLGFNTSTISLGTLYHLFCFGIYFVLVFSCYSILSAVWSPWIAKRDEAWTLLLLLISVYTETMDTCLGNFIFLYIF